MDAVLHYPHDAVLGACFVSGRYEVAEGEHVLDTGIDVESLPMGGRLCLSQRAVLDMCETLGLKIATAEMIALHEAALEALSDAVEELDELTHAMSGIVNIQQVQRAMEVIERRASADKAEIAGWVDSLPAAAKR